VPLTQRELSLRSALLLAVAFGLATGWGEVAYRGIEMSVLGSILFQSRDLIWMAPVSNALLFVACGVLLFAIGRRVPRVRTPRAFVFLFASLLTAAPLTSYPRLHWAAGWLLAAGVGWRVSAWVGDPGPGFKAATRVAGAVLAMLTVIGLGYSIWAREDHGSRTTAVEAANAPNVVLVVWDTVRDKSVGLHEAGPETTPNLAALARTGISFDLAMATSSWTLPSHASLFTGHFPDEFDADWTVPLHDEFPTLAEVLGDAGYDTAGFAGNLLYCAWDSGLSRGFDHYEDYPVTFRMLLRSAWLTRGLASRVGILEDPEFTATTAPRVRQEFLAWLDARKDRTRPFFAFLNLADAHAPYTPTPETFARFSHGHARATSDDPQSWTPEEVDAERAAYEAEIASLDSELGTLLNDLEVRGKRDHTLLIVVSDHGDSFGEHGLFGHGNALYRPLLHVPLVISMPSLLPQNVRVQDPVSIAEIPATVLSLVRPGKPHPFPGVDLSRIGDGLRARPARATLRSHRGIEAFYPLSRGHMSAAIDGDWYYILNGDGVEELFRLSEDPEERTDEAHDEEAVVARMRSLVTGKP